MIEGETPPKCGHCRIRMTFTGNYKDFDGPLECDRCTAMMECPPADSPDYADYMEYAETLICQHFKCRSFDYRCDRCGAVTTTNWRGRRGEMLLGRPER